MNKKMILPILIVVGALLAYVGYRYVRHIHRLNSAAQASASQAQTPKHIKVYLVAINDNGKLGTKIGCGDSLVSSDVEVPSSKDKNVTTALTKLFAIKQQNFGTGNYYNALYQSNLKLDGVTTDTKGIETVTISGTVKIAGECDNPRFVQQIKATVAQFKSGANAIILVNDKPIDEAVSLK
jgi:hypothetical protein